MAQTVFFPGKFHPPHLGHARTILKLIPRYSKVIIGVSGDVPSDEVTSVDEIVCILNDLFTPFENVEVVRIEGVLVEKNSLKGLPKFDILLSGNPVVLEWAKKMGIKSEYLPRSEGMYFSGTEIRRHLNGHS